MSDNTLPLPGLSSVGGKTIVAGFDGGSLSSDAGVLALAAVEQRLGVAARLAACIHDPRSPELIVHSLTDMIGLRMMMCAAGYEDVNDAGRLRLDPAFKGSFRPLPQMTPICRSHWFPHRCPSRFHCARFLHVS